jgi:hypothetical protein
VNGPSGVQELQAMFMVPNVALSSTSLSSRSLFKLRPDGSQQSGQLFFILQQVLNLFNL